MRALGPYSRATAFAGLDGRSSDAQAMRRVRAELVAHVGGTPNAVQRALIERAVMLQHQVAMMDARHSDSGWSERDGRQYLAWTGALTRILSRLGLKAAPAPQRSLQEHLAARGASA